MPSQKNEPIIDNLKLRDFFKDDVYSVPSFQRDYAWGKSEARDLVSDLYEWSTDEDQTPYYLMGQVVVVSDEVDGSLIIVDGQQRITTLFLLLLAIDRRLSESGFQTNGVHENLVRSQLTSSIVIGFVDGLPIARIQLAETAGEENDSNQKYLLNLILNDGTHRSARGATQSNLASNLRVIETELNSRFAQSDELFRFLDQIMAGVYISRLEVESIPQALDIFEKLNNRGLNLSSADLLKNLLFQRADASQYKSISTNWNEASTTIYSIKPKRASKMEFLIKAMIAAETGQSFSTAKVYRAWLEHFKNVDGSLNRFQADISTKSSALLNLSKRNGLDGNKLKALYGPVYFGAVQHFTVLLAGTHLNSNAFFELVRIVEQRTVLSLLAKERSQDFERMLPEWASSIFQLPADASPDEVFAASERGMRDIEVLFEMAKTALSNLTYTRNNDLEQIRYILTRISIRIEASANQNAETLWKRGLLEQEIGVELEKPFDIEHIQPQSVGVDDSDSSESWKNSIGNLVLMHYSDNRSAGAKLPSEKVGHYNSSELLLTRSLCDEEALGAKSPRIARIMNRLQKGREWSLASWGPISVASRESLYWEMLKDEFNEVFRIENND